MGFLAAHSAGGEVYQLFSSAMTQQKLPHFRRLSQIVFLLFFLFLMMKTESFSSLHAVRNGARLPYPVSFFLQLDPLTALASASRS